MEVLSNKRVLITGASGEIGSAIAEEFHKNGCEVLLSGTREEPLTNLAEKLGDRAHFILTNLKNMKNAHELIENSIKKLGGIDILINNAGITRDTIFLRMSDEAWTDVLEVNLNSSMVLARGAIKNMMKSRWGRIINITSVVGFTGNPGQANYAASKSGLIGMSKSIAREVASRGITVNCIAPGFISSAMTRKLTEEQKKRILTNIPMNRMGEPSDIASAVVFLCSSAANYLTGQTLHINGGMAMI